MQEFNKDIIEVVGEKGRIIEGYDPAKFRQDACGAWITRDKYGPYMSPQSARKTQCSRRCSE